MDEKVYCFACCGCTVFLTLMIMLITSFIYIEYNEYAFKKNTTTNKVDTNDVYTNGRYVWGFDHDKVVFPRLFQSLNLELSVANAEGVSVDIDVSFLYRFPKKNLQAIYQKYGTSYGTQIKSISTAAVRNSAVKFSVNEFLSNRSVVREQLAHNVSQALSTVMFVEAPSYSLQLNEIVFSDTILTTHLNAAITLEENSQKEYEQDAAVIRYTTDKLVQQITANTTVITRTAEANYTAMIDTAEAQKDEIVSEARGLGLASTITALGIDEYYGYDDDSNQTTRQRFLKLMAILDNADATIVDLDGSSSIVNLNN